MLAHKYDFPHGITEDALMAKLDDADSGVRMLALLHARSCLDMWLRGLDDRELFIYEIAVGQVRRYVRMLSETVKAEPWEFHGMGDGELIFRRGDDRIALTPDELRQAIKDQFFEKPTKSGDTLFYVDVLASMAK